MEEHVINVLLTFGNRKQFVIYVEMYYYLLIKNQKIEYILKVDLENRYGDLFKVVSTA